MTTTPTQQLSDAGVSIWLDDLSRERLSSGSLQKLIEEKNVVGVTTNPSIFHAAITAGSDYDAVIAEEAAKGATVEETVFEITTTDVADACDLFAPVAAASNGVDGRVSIEVDPRLAWDTEGTIAEAKHLYKKVNKDNVHIKIPATLEGLAAITATLAEGISVNVTLIFSLERYRAVINAFQSGLELAKENGHDLSKIHSVASFFVSRVDTEIDKRLNAIGTDEAKALKGKAGVANARLAYQVYEELFSTERWAVLAEAGALPQRPLWASTGVKDPAYPDTLYVTELVAAGVVNTMPEKTLDATFDHGVVTGDTISGTYEEANNVLNALEGLASPTTTSSQSSNPRAWTSSSPAGRNFWPTSKVPSPLHGRLPNPHEHSQLRRQRCCAAGHRATHPGTCRRPDCHQDFRQGPHSVGPDAESESAIRLGWVEAATVSQPLVEGILELRDALRAEGVSRIVLCGMGGSSLAPEVIAGTTGVELTVLDSTDPEQVGAALADRLAETAIVVSSKSGSTVETDSQRRVFEQAFTEAGIDAKSRIVIVTDPGSPLDKASREAGYRAVFNADPNVGGRFSALTAFGLVPSGLAGVDIQAFLDEAEEAAEILNEDSPENIGLRLGAALGGTTPLRNKIVIVEDGSGIVGFADWAEQLIAESTGKLGTGVLPVVAGPSAPEVSSGAEDVLVIRLVGAESDVQLGENEAAIAGGLATQMFVWEFATSVAGRLLGINPFDQPDVEAAKIAARGLLDARPEPTPANFVDGAIEVRGGAWLGDAATAADAVKALLGELGTDGYLSVQAYFDRIAFAQLEGIRDELAGSAAARSLLAGVRASCTPPGNSTRADRPSVRSCK
ncbi:transaldolase [Arthrobacter sp. Hiyo8]|nr:transaldolase [Arthrobacter sp. Hiyo8]